MQTVREQAKSRIAEVEAAFTRAEGAWRGAGTSIASMFGMSPQDQVLGAIKSMRELGLNPWRNRTSKLADTDTAGWSTWVKDGNDLLHNLATTAQDADTATIQAIVVGTVTETAKDVKQVATTVWSARWLIVAGLIAIAAIAWKLKP